MSRQPALGSAATARAVPAALATTVVLAQIAYPLTDGVVRHRLTVATVVVFFATSATHALLWRGWRFALLLVAVTAGVGLAVEVVGTATGWPFGAYRYTGTLGPHVAGIPVVIPLAWTMMAYPALLVGARISPHPLGAVIAGAVALTAWDLFLDPQMVAEGHWVWDAGGPAVLGIPLTNYAGWFLTALVMMATLVPALRATAARAGQADDRVPYVLYGWVYGSSVLAHAVFFGLPGSALVGGVGMGLVLVFFVRATRERAGVRA